MIPRPVCTGSTDLEPISAAVPLGFKDLNADSARAESGTRRGRLFLVFDHTLTALRFFFMVTLRKPDVVVQVPFVREPRRLPVVLSPEEVARLLDAAPGRAERRLRGGFARVRG